MEMFDFFLTWSQASNSPEGVLSCTNDTVLYSDMLVEVAVDLLLSSERYAMMAGDVYETEGLG